jgi:RNA polymerase sigma-70 factor (ECF subfamily)
MFDNCDSTNAVLARRRIEVWIRQARGGSTAALGSLIEHCRRYLLSVANQELPPELRAKLGASDLVQDTAFEIQAAFGQFSGERQEEFLAWARGILIHNASNARRQYRETAKRQISREVSLDDDNSWLKSDLVARDAPPGAAAVASELAAEVEAAVERLPVHFREVIYLRHRDRRSFAEIGQTLGRTSEAVRKLWQRGIERLSDELNLPDDDA